jgi:hypothetical protein
LVQWTISSAGFPAIRSIAIMHWPSGRMPSKSPRAGFFFGALRRHFCGVEYTRKTDDTLSKIAVSAVNAEAA